MVKYCKQIIVGKFNKCFNIGRYIFKENIYFAFTKDLCRLKIKQINKTQRKKRINL